MPTLMEARQAVLDDVIREMESCLDGSHPAPRPPTVAEMASFRARTNLCTGLGAGEVANYLTHYHLVRQAYYVALADGTPGELLAIWVGVIAAYQEAQYQACIAAPRPLNVSIDLGPIILDAVAAHRARDLPIEGNQRDR